nr:flagellar biosynthetic protein FliR [Herbaspirillum frisingense]
MAAPTSPFALSALPVMANPVWVATVFLVATRLAAALLMTPVLYAFPMPALIRVLLIIAISTLFVFAFPGMRIMGDLSVGSLIVSVLGEVMLGAVLGLSIMLAFSAFSVAGALLDVQIGYGIAQVIDPATRRQIPILTSLFNQVSVLVFFLVNGHHALLRGLAYSFERFPRGNPGRWRSPPRRWPDRWRDYSPSASRWPRRWCFASCWWRWAWACWRETCRR